MANDKEERVKKQMAILNKFATGSKPKRKYKSKAQSPQEIKQWLKEHPYER